MPVLDVLKVLMKALEQQATRLSMRTRIPKLRVCMLKARHIVLQTLLVLGRFGPDVVVAASSVAQMVPARGLGDGERHGSPKTGTRSQAASR